MRLFTALKCCSKTFGDDEWCLCNVRAAKTDKSNLWEPLKCPGQDTFKSQNAEM